MTDPHANPQPVPNHQPLDRYQRLLELLTGLAPFAFLGLLVLLSRFWLVGAVAALLIYTLAWLVRVLGYSYRLLTSYYYLKLALCIDWEAKLADVMRADGQAVSVAGFWQKQAEQWYRSFLANGVAPSQRLDPAAVYHAIIIAVYNEEASIIESTLQAVVASRYESQKIMAFIAYEARGSAATEQSVKRLVRRYKGDVKFIKAVKHPAGLPGEARAKAGNITYAAQRVAEYCAGQGLPPEQVLVTTLDADNRPHPQYLAALTWTYALAGDRVRRSYQPVPLFTNNIWDVPAVVRIIAADTTFWYLIAAMQPTRLRLFSAYAQSLQTLQDTNYWNVEVVVEDGHQYWRTYFAYRGNYMALPVLVPIYQDAVMSPGYWQTLRAQFRQLERWAWSTYDTPWILRQAWRDRSISWPNKLVHILRQLDDYMTWSTAPIVLAIGGWLPLWLSPHPEQSIMAFQLPLIIHSLQLAAGIGLLVPALASLLTLPPRPAHHGPLKSMAMVLQWALEPVALLGFITPASLAAHLRLIFNKPLETFYVTTKARRTAPSKLSR